MANNKRKLDPKDIQKIVYDRVTNTMEIFNHKDLLIHKQVVREEVFNTAGNRLLNYRREGW